MKNAWLWIAGALLLFRATKRETKDTMRLSKDFRLQEFVSADQLAAGVTFDQLQALKDLVDNVLQPARDKTGIPIRVTSGLRSMAKNVAAGGVPQSQHLYGMAADIQPIPATKDNYKKLWDAITSEQYDQLIWENAKAFTGTPSHLHVSYVSFPGQGKYTFNRMKKLEYLNGKYNYI